MWAEVFERRLMFDIPELMYWVCTQHEVPVFVDETFIVKLFTRKQIYQFKSLLTFKTVNRDINWPLNDANSMNTTISVIVKQTNIA